MTMSLVIEHFDNLLAIPEDVEQLNRAILHLAIQGKLLMQDNTDEPASEILKRIITAKSELDIKEIFSPIGDDEKPFELPKTWEWTRLNDICSRITDGTHYTPKYLYDGVPFLSVKDVSKGFLDFSNTKFISQEEHDLFATRCKPELGDVILTKVGTTGIAVVVDTEKEFSIFVSLALLKFFQNEIAPEFLALVINSPFVKGLSEKYTMGVGNKNLVLKHIKSFPIPLPPFAEQQRIVARVEELFVQTRALAKELEHSQSELDGLNQSALSHLLASETPEEFNQHWDFIAEHFDLLFQTPEHVAPLRQSILELAVRGKLTRREAGDESAGELLKRISEEKEKLVSEGLISKSEIYPPIKEDEAPFPLSDGWEWARLDEVCSLVVDIAHQMPKSVDKGVKFISAKDLLDDGTINFENNIKLISEEDFENLAKRVRPQRGDIIYSRIGARLGKARVVKTDEKFMVSYSCCIVRPLLFDVEYLNFYLDSGIVLDQAQVHTKSIGVPDLGMKKIKSFLIAVPPLQEQKRIVTRANELKRLCDALEGRLQSAEEERGRLVAAVMAGVGGKSV